MHSRPLFSLDDPERDRASALVYAIDSRVMSLSWLSHLYLILGHPEKAFFAYSKVPAFVDDVAHPATSAVALAWGCIFLQLVGGLTVRRKLPRNSRAGDRAGLSALPGGWRGRAWLGFGRRRTRAGRDHRTPPRTYRIYEDRCQNVVAVLFRAACERQSAKRQCGERTKLSR